MNPKYTLTELRLINNIEAGFNLINHSEEDLMALVRDISMLGMSQRKLAIDYLAKAKSLTLNRLELMKRLQTAKKPSGPTWN